MKLSTQLLHDLEMFSRRSAEKTKREETPSPHKSFTHGIIKLKRRMALAKKKHETSLRESYKY